MIAPPSHVDVVKDRGVTLRWPDGAESFLPVALLRRMSPSADARELREAIARNPLTVIPGAKGNAGPLAIRSAEIVGNYALRLEFSDGHSTGLYTWEYLRGLDAGGGASGGPSGGRSAGPS